ncbi:Putative nucleoporin [Verticillium dahliae VDG2]|nr:Putative nucleoporin [Verticillium dahliae VDG2]
MSANSPIPTIDGQPKRVILRLRYNEFNDDDSSHTEAVQAYLGAIGRKVDECNPKGRHVSHVESRQDYMENNPKASFHVTLDMEKDAIENPDLDKLPHEIYRIRRKADGTL